MRVADTRRGTPVRLVIDGHAVDAFAGETVAAAMLADGRITFGGPGLLCNMGTCSGCLVTAMGDRRDRRVRACLLPVEDGLRIDTGGTA